MSERRTEFHTDRNDIVSEAEGVKMLILGISGGNIHHNGHVHRFGDHDCSASLTRDGVLIAAVEEERLDRLKHSNNFPAKAIRACLEETGTRLADVDAVAFNWPEEYINTIINEPHYIHRWAQPNQGTILSCRTILSEWFKKEFDVDFEPTKFIFPPHHESHAMSAFAHSGMDTALVVVLDGRGEQFSGTIFRGDPTGVTQLHNYPISESLGMFYLAGTVFLGYSFGDEYKVMGLAPHGNPETYRPLFNSLYRLRSRGEYDLYWDVPNKSYDPANNPSNHLARACIAYGLAPRKAGAPFTQQHKDIAAALQEALERIVIHVLSHWQGETGISQLCLSGGVAHNSSLNGTILRTGMFKEMFVHPASHDGGGGEGAALSAEYQLSNRPLVRARLRTAGFGPALGKRRDIQDQLDSWRDWIDYELCDDIARKTAGLVADGAVVGWAQGRSEFGPRALGSRSIVADPRPKENQSRINAMVKKRESFRPFAPVTIPEAAHEYFELPATRANYDFMSYVVKVRPQHRDQLAAVTHVDGTARIQIVEQDSDPLFYELVAEFGNLTGVPVLLNTSFNNNAEPIVQSAEDAVVCFLTTNLDFLVIDSFLAKRRDDHDASIEDLVAELADMTILTRRDYSDGETHNEMDHFVSRQGPKEPQMAISPEIYQLLRALDGRRDLRELIAPAKSLSPEDSECLLRLWEGRFVRLRPRHLRR